MNESNINRMETADVYQTLFAPHFRSVRVLTFLSLAYRQVFSGGRNQYSK